MGEVSSDTAEKIGERLAEAMVEQVGDLGGTPAEFRVGMGQAAEIINSRVKSEHGASKVAQAEAAQNALHLKNALHHLHHLRRSIRDPDTPRYRAVAAALAGLAKLE